ncbi:DUF1499 domain-containing protein [Aquisalimonas lutea]|uniref:DUF1499 domain-containing protein n=1 Tax=Aquisalimonas lutea TaxID=1327750 RepID=UPI0025B2F347|nr:DUF1499 domain-containing protein [Aquisalimonas lutea]MDN3518629.1 DUF1499 domain-containing protein [Aquisalimonas lutea]
MDALNALLKIVLALVLLVVLLVTGALVRNAPPMMDTPGPLVRLATYVTTNSVEVRADAARPELRNRLYAVAPEQLWRAARAAVERLEWRVLHADADNLALQAVATTPLLRFQDDVFIRVRRAEHGLSTLYFRASSRIGRADLAMNTRHLRKFRRILEQELQHMAAAE